MLFILSSAAGKKYENTDYRPNAIKDTFKAGSKEPGAPVRRRKVKTVPDRNSYVAVHNQNTNDIPKPKYAPESKPSIASKRPLDKRPTPQLTNQQIQKTKVANQNTNRPVQKTAPLKQEFKRPMQKNNALQKTKPQAAVSVQKNKTTTSEGKLTQRPQNTNNNKQKTVPQKTAPSEKTKPENTEPAKNISEDGENRNTEETKPAQKTHIAQKMNDQKTTDGLKDKAVEASKDDKEFERLEDTMQMMQEADHQKTSESTEKRELDPLLARVLEEELQDIMIQVWQELPDDPVEKDRIAVDKLRNEIGDDFRRVLGLNVTKRLLNIYNNLFVKIDFSCRPQMGCLTKFLNEYRIKKFKRIDKNSNMFAAQIETMEHFDKLCNAYEITCGNARVTVTPCYKYTQCPENLNTIYDDSYYEDCSQESEERDIKNNVDSNKTETNSNEDSTDTQKTVKNEDTKVTDKAEIEKKAILDSNDSVDLKDKTVDTQKATNSSKTVENKDLINKEISITDKADTDDTTDDSVIKINIVIESVASKSMNLKDAETNKNIQVTKSIKDTETNKNNLEDVSKNVTKDIEINKLETKDAEGNNNATKVLETNKNITKDTDVSENVTKGDIIDDKLDIADYEDYLETDIPENQFDSDEELNDEDILALMSKGVVLDECSGSDDES